MRQEGFTLIELLVVIAVIAILAAILFPVFARAKAAAGDARTMSNSKQLGTALQLYLADSDDIYPQATDGPPGVDKTGGWVYYSAFGNALAGKFDVTRGSLFPYVTATEVYLSSGDPDAKVSGNSFAFNGALGKFTGTGINPSGSATATPFPASTMLLGEEGCGDGSGILGYPYVHGTNDGYFNPLYDHFGKFHPAGSAIIYCDTHAKMTDAEGHWMETVCGSLTQCF